MRIFGIAVVKDDVDVIESFVRHNRALLDAFLVVDHGSTDGTRELLERLSREVPGLSVADDATEDLGRGAILTEVARGLAASIGFDFLIPLLGGQFISCDGRASLERSLLTVPAGVCGSLRRVTYVPHATDDVARPDVVRRLTHRLSREQERWHEAAIPISAIRDSSFAIEANEDGALSVSTGSPASALSGVQLACFPFRSQEQAIVEILTRSWAAFRGSREDRATGTFEHRFAERLERDPRMSQDELQAMALDRLAAGPVELVEDPLRVRSETALKWPELARVDVLARIVSFAGRSFRSPARESVKLTRPWPASPRSERPTITVVVPTFESADTLQSCLDSAAANLAPGDSLIVADAGSSDDTLDLAQRFADGWNDTVRIIRAPTHGRLAEAVSVGLAASTGEVSVLVPAAVGIPPGFLDETTALLASRGAAAVAVEAPGRGMSVVGRNTLLQRVAMTDSEALLDGSGLRLGGVIRALRRELVYVPAPVPPAASAPGPSSVIRGSAGVSLPQYYLCRRTDVIEAVPARALRILDVGCAGGVLGQALKERDPRRRVVGIEAVPEAAKRARTVLDEVHEVDAETFDPPFRRGEFDCIVFADVLEHMRDPWAVIRRLVRFLAPGGTVVASIPNVRCLSVLEPLAGGGRWDYQEEGILDRTHLRFFTKSTFISLLAQVGVRRGTIQLLGWEGLGSFAPGPDGLVRKGRLAIEGVSPEEFGDLAAFQFLFVGTFDGEVPESAGAPGGLGSGDGGWVTRPWRGSPVAGGGPSGDPSSRGANTPGDRGDEAPRCFTRAREAPESGIALVTASFGEIDGLKPLPPHPGVDALFYTDEAGAAAAAREASRTWSRVIVPNYPRHDFDSRLRAKYFKLQIHRLDEVRGHRWLAWADSSLEFRDLEFLGQYATRLARLPPNQRLLLVPHPERRTIREEFRYIQSRIEAGDPYLTVRYGKEKMPDQMEYYRARRWNLEAKLWCGGFWMMEDCDLLQKTWNDWWDHNLRFGIMDQLSLSVVLEDNGIEPQDLPVNLWDNAHFTVARHQKLM